MRVIFNIPSNRAAGAAGWRAREVNVNRKHNATLDEVLKAVTLADGSMNNYIIEKDLLKNDWLLYVNGISIHGPSCLKTSLKDNTQIHLMDNPGATERCPFQNITM
jgi:hypothetical protein